MKIRLSLLALLLAAPAFGQSIWPASKVQFADTDTLEDERDRERTFQVGTLPTCDAGAKGNVFTIDDGANNSDCGTGSQSTFVECGCDGTVYRALSGGGAAVEINALVADGVSGINDNEVAIGDTTPGSVAYVEVDQCNTTTEKLNFDGTGFVCNPDQTGGAPQWDELEPGTLSAGSFLVGASSVISPTGGGFVVANVADANLIDKIDGVTGEIDAGVKRGPDTDAFLVTTNIGAPGGNECVEMTLTGTIVVTGSPCGSGGAHDGLIVWSGVSVLNHGAIHDYGISNQATITHNYNVTGSADPAWVYSAGLIKATGVTIDIEATGNLISAAALIAGGALDGRIEIFDTTGGGSRVTIKAADIDVSDWTWTLPQNNGAIHALMRTDGTGLTSWVLIADANVAVGADIAGDKIVTASTSVIGVVNLATLSEVNLGTAGVLVVLASTHDQADMTGDLGGTFGAATVDNVQANAVAQLTDIIATLKTGTAGPDLVTGAAGGTGNCAEWDGNGDLIEAVSGAPCGSGGGMTSFFFDGDSGPAQTVGNNQTMQVNGTNGIVTEAVATRILEIGVKSDEPGFIIDLGAGDLTCGSGNAGKMAVNDADVLQYCNGTAGENRNTIAAGNDNGEALAIATGAINNVADLAVGIRTGDDAKVVTGEEGGTGFCAEWNLDGDLVEAASGAPCGSGGSVAGDGIWDVKGDLAVATTDNTAVRLGIGTADFVLMADAGPAVGMAWKQIVNASVAVGANIAGSKIGSAATGSLGVTRIATQSEVDIGTEAFEYVTPETLVNMPIGGDVGGDLDATTVDDVQTGAVAQIADIATGLRSDSTANQLATTSAAFPTPNECVEMNSIGRLVLAGDTCANLGPGGTPSAIVAVDSNITMADPALGTATITIDGTVQGVWDAGGLTLFGGDATDQLILPLQDDALTPTLAFGDGDTGIYQHLDSGMRMTFDGAWAWEFDFAHIEANIATGPTIIKTISGLTNAAFVPDKGDFNTGLGANGADAVGLIAGGVSGFVMIEGANGAVVAGETVILLPTDVTGDPNTAPADQLYLYVKNDSLWIKNDLGAAIDIGAHPIQAGDYATGSLVIGDIDSTSKSGIDTELITGTIATTDRGVKIDANDDLVESQFTPDTGAYATPLSECIMLMAGGAELDASIAPTRSIVDGTNFPYQTLDFSDSIAQRVAWTFPTPPNLTGTQARVTLYYIGNTDCDDAGPTSDDVCFLINSDSIALEDTFDKTLGGTQLEIQFRCGVPNETVGKLDERAAAPFTHSMLPNEIGIVLLSRDPLEVSAECTTGEDDLLGELPFVALEFCYDVNNVFSGEG